MQQMIETSRPVVRLYLNFLRQNNRSIISSTINGFFIRLEEYPEKRNALDALGFKSYLDELQKANKLHEKLFMKRLSHKSEMRKVDTTGIQHEAQFVLRKLFDQIEFYQYMRKEVDYSPLINQINEIIAQYTGLINMRATCRKTREKKTERKAAELEEKVLAEEVSSSRYDAKLTEEESSTPKKEAEEVRPAQFKMKNDVHDFTTQNVMSNLENTNEDST